MPNLVEVNNMRFPTGISKEQVVVKYREWSKKYDEDMRPSHYKGPEVAANAVASLHKEKDRPRVRILDVAAGTGLVGINLQKLGFMLIDALDPCEDMLKVLQSTGSYKKIYKEYICIGKSSVPSDAYDVVVVCGGMGQGHIPVQGLDEMLRMTKPGGYVCNAMRREYKDTVEHYKDKLLPHIESLEKNKKMEEDQMRSGRRLFL